MQTRDEELEQFKTDINLTAYAAGQGFQLDKRGTSRNSVMMRNATGEKIIIARALDGHWVYFNVHQDSDQGSIIDFVQSRDGLNLGQVRKELRPWMGKSPRVPIAAYVPDLEPLPRDVAAVRSRYERFTPIEGRHPYLEGRGLSPTLLSDRRFSGRIRTDEHHNAIFPHRDRDGICGYEIKNKEFTGFARGGAKGLWYSRRTEEPSAYIIAETAIDALSYAALHPDDQAIYFSIAGQLSPEQKDLLRSTVAKKPPETPIILAMDNDEAGKALIETITGLISAEDCPGVEFRPHTPPEAGQDWNDALRANLGKVDHIPQTPPPENI